MRHKCSVDTNQYMKKHCYQLPLTRKARHSVRLGHVHGTNFGDRCRRRGRRSALTTGGQRSAVSADGRRRRQEAAVSGRAVYRSSSLLCLARPVRSLPLEARPESSRTPRAGLTAPAIHDGGRRLYGGKWNCETHQECSERAFECLRHSGRCYRGSAVTEMRYVGAISI